MLDPAASESIRELPDPGPALQLLSGPEGGFSADERARAVASGYRAIRLGPRVLRTETAAIAALAGVQLLWGDLGD
jgi:16S rRNA (uracil1498-N3)-methyltransferase